MRSIKLGAIGLIVVIVGFWGTLRILTVDVPIGFVGVRIQEYGFIGKKGLVPKDFGSGYHRDLGPIDSWVFFDSTAQTLEMTREKGRGSDPGQDDVKVQSSDGYAVSVDVTVKYKIREEFAHKLYADTGSGTAYKQIVRSEAQRTCMELFGELETEDFYNPEVRRNTGAKAREKLSESLSDNFVDVIDVLVRDVQFDPEYEGKIRMRKLADQEVELNKSLANAETMRGKTQVIEAETKRLVAVIKKEKEAEIIRMEADTDLEIAKIKAEYEKYATELTADAELIAAQKQAEGELLVKKAEAEGERLRNEAMMGVGGSTIVALEAAQNLTFKDVTISTLDVDILDIDAMATKLGASESKK